MALLDFGSLDAQISVAALQAHEQLIAYRKAVIDAVKDADDAIASYAAPQRLRDLSDAVRPSRRPPSSRPLHGWWPTTPRNTLPSLTAA